MLKIIPFLSALLIMFFVSCFLFNSSLNYYFFQDDFFELNISQAKTVNEYFNFFEFRNDIIAYRPISLQNYFFLSSKIFGPNPAGFRVVTFTFFFSSALIIIMIVKILTGSLAKGLLTSTLWLWSSIHFMSITWIAAAYNIIGTFFWLLTSLLFLKYVKKNNFRIYLLTILSFLITVGSFEFSVTWAPIFAFYYFYVLKKPLLKTIKIFSPFILISMLYIILRTIFIQIPQMTEYAFKFDLNSTKAFFWYILWTFNIPEEFKKQIIDKLIIFNPKFLSEYWPLVLRSFLGASSIIIFGLIAPAAAIFIKKKRFHPKIIVFAIFWFTVSISPVLFLPNHTFTMYLTLASIGIYFLISHLIISSKIKPLIPAVIFIWLLSSINTLNFYKINSWMIESQKTSGNFQKIVQKHYSQFPDNSVLYYPLNSHWERQSLLESHAIKAIYKNYSLSIYYNKEDLIKDSKLQKVRGEIYILNPYEN